MVMPVLRGIVMICGRVEDKIIRTKDVTELRGHCVGCSFMDIGIMKNYSNCVNSRKNDT